MIREYTAILLLLLIVCSAASAQTVYVVKPDPANPRKAIVSVERGVGVTAVRLVLRGIGNGFGVRPQVEQPSCDGVSLGMEKPGVWSVPAICAHLQWRIAFDLPGGQDASGQQSVLSQDGSFRLISEASSLPRLANSAGAERLRFEGVETGRIFPAPASDGSIALPELNQAPLFVVIDSTPVAQVRQDRIAVRYFLDEPGHLDRVPSIAVEARGLAWLASLAPASRNTDFTYAWLGLPDGSPSIGGATGTGVLMVNYLRVAPQDLSGSIASAAAPLIEATHQLGAAFGPRPGWVEESLAVYFGVRALAHAMDGSSEPAELMARISGGASHFMLGLLEAQKQVNAGDRRNYGAFFAKGMAFWNAVDAAIKKRGDTTGLEAKLEAVWMAKFGSDGEPPADFAVLLGLDKDQWHDLRKQFLES